MTFVTHLAMQIVPIKFIVLPSITARFDRLTAKYIYVPLHFQYVSK